MANSIDPDQTVPLGAVSSGSTLLAKILVPVCGAERIKVVYICKHSGQSTNNAFHCLLICKGFSHVLDNCFKCPISGLVIVDWAITKQ